MNPQQQYYCGPDAALQPELLQDLARLVVPDRAAAALPGGNHRLVGSTFCRRPGRRVGQRCRWRRDAE